ncbi:hypothetical protein FRACYDRAFT_240911 [Fragilariopsis cylindrus CCMP1102]|uniref:Uncharacterized protein n=1 Tax=Fragilariopsis cylindrus CCMP1102 TaxID=635003 RepID=A0A1E7F869_9STRA|nr:hypothetical protein FRACYDRAFT_240911 [Fragilariopsis cylindrus CCMP1102]|eukprot:OEU14370.1 hypothetical protein FRACYDRAFT_240911 [Fragilariopsis cylindrus CCMP1102]
MTTTMRSFNNTSSNGNKFKLFILVIMSSTYFWKLFMCTIFTTIIVRQYTNTYHNIHVIIHNTDDAGYSSLQQQQQKSLSLLSSSSSLSSIIDDGDVNNNNVNSNVKVVLTDDDNTDDDNDDRNKPLLFPLPLLSNMNMNMNMNVNMNLNLNLNLNLGNRWKKSVKAKLKEQEKVRSRGKNQDEKIDIQSNFKRLQNRLNVINTTIEIDNPNNWHTVTSKSYEKIRFKAHQSIKNDLRLSNKIHTDCILWLVPPSISASSSSSSTDKNTNIIRAFQDENDGKDRDNYNQRKDQTTRKKGNDNVGPQIKFQCDLNNTSEVLVLQDEPCSSSANLCRVETNMLLWNDYYENSMNMNINMNNNTNSSNSSSSSTYFNYTKIKESIIMMPPPSSINSSSSSSSSSSKSTTFQSSSKKSKSTLLTMVDTIQYLKYGHQYIWECFLNKASYSLRTKQTFYIWIGTLEKSESKSESSVVEENNNNRKMSSSTTNTTEEESRSTSTKSNNILHQRNSDTIYKNFGTKCNPESMTTNTINYYKPIAFITLFQKLLSLDNNNKNNNNEEQEQEEQRVWFVDADIFFNEEAYPTTTPNNNNNNNNPNNTTTTDYSDSDLLPLPLLQSLDDYFDLSTTAILFGAQNPSGKSENIVLNGGLLGLRLFKHAHTHNATTARSSSRSSKTEAVENENENEIKEWNVFDFASLWWYCRCGERDQIALWLVLFATWSAESSHSSSTISASSSSSSAHTTTTSTNNNNNNDSVVSSIQQEQLAFSYPGVIFENYLFSWYGVIPHIHQYLQQKLKNNNNNNNRVQPVQQQHQHQQKVQQQHQVVNNQFNGGLEFLNSKYGNAIFTYPLELPHLLVLPLDPFQVRSSTTTPPMSASTSTSTSTSSQQSTSTSQPPPFQEEKIKNAVMPLIVVFVHQKRAEERSESSALKMFVILHSVSN